MIRLRLEPLMQVASGFWKSTRRGALAPGVMFAAVAAGAWSVPTQAPPDVRVELQRLLDSLVAQHSDVPGVALHVDAPKLRLDWTGTAGFADRTTRAPLGERTPFRIASNTKTYVAAAILRLWEQGKLSLNDPIAKHLPVPYLKSLEADGYDPKAITVRHLLSHTSGIYDWGTDSAYQRRVMAEPRHRWSRMEQVQFAMDHGAPYGRPGEVFHYSDTGYILLGQILEQVSKMPMPRAIRTLVHYDQVGLSSTWFETLEPKPPGAADRAHQFEGDQDTYAFDPSFDLWGGGGIVATTRDMARFTRALFRGGVFDRKETTDTMLTNPPARDQRGYRFGIGERMVGGVRGYGHTGYWNTMSFYFPELDLTVSGSITQNREYRLAGKLLEDAVATVRKHLN
jgi:D-alanyl-D-alanine carboxypeptidase